MFIFEWGPEGGDGLVPAFERYVTSLANDHGLEVELTGPDAPLPLSRTTQIQLYGIAREALTNIIKHAGTSWRSCASKWRRTHVILEIEDRGHGFDLGESRAGTTASRRCGAGPARSRAGSRSRRTAGQGTLVRVEVPSGLA